MLSPHQSEVLRNTLCIDGNAIKPGAHVKMLGVTIDEIEFLYATLMKWVRKLWSRWAPCVD